MVKMMLDLPLNAGDGTMAAAASGTSGSAGAPRMSTDKLYATTIGMKKPSTAEMQPRGKSGAQAAVANASAPQAPAKKSSTGMWIGIAAAAAVVIGGGLYMMSGSSSQPPATAEATRPVAEAPVPAVASKSAAPTATRAAADVPTPAAPTPSPKSAGRSTTDASANFIVTSNPSGARVTLNGVDTGKVTPSAMSLSAKQSNTIQLSKSGYQPLSATISAADLQAGSREFALARQSGPVQLTVVGAFPFDLYQGGKLLSSSQVKHEVTVEPGAGPVVARNKDYVLNYTVPVDFQRSQADVTVPNPGKLSIFSQVETCTVSIDGLDLGPVPIPSKTIAAGAHSVTLKCADGRTETQPTTLDPGGKATVTFLKPKAE